MPSLAKVADIIDIGIDNLDELAIVEEGPYYIATIVAVASTVVTASTVVIASTDVDIEGVGINKDILNDLDILVDEGSTSVVKGVFTEGYSSLVSLYIALTKAARDFLNIDLSIG